ncbi:hypothetical protein B0H13DRAFT_1869706 [Mycena leptocephala]|nr:hypothetical protein B0H13DRAFT_1869706 [Mycena leptocephala]
MAPKFFQAFNKLNLDGKTFTITIYPTCGSDKLLLSPNCTFQSQSAVTAQYLVSPIAIEVSAYLGFRNGSLEKLTITDVGFDDSHETFELRDLLHIWRKNKVAEKNPAVDWSPPHTAVFGPENLCDDDLTMNAVGNRCWKNSIGSAVEAMKQP